MKAVSVLFPNSPRQYDYLCPFDDVKVGDNVEVVTRRGSATVIVAEVKDHSDRATAQITRIVRDDAKTDINKLF